MSKIVKLLEDAKTEQETINKKKKTLIETMKEITTAFSELIADFNKNSGSKYIINAEISLYSELAVYIVRIEGLTVRYSCEWACRKGLISEEDFKALIKKLEEFIQKKAQIKVDISIPSAFYRSKSEDYEI